MKKAAAPRAKISTAKNETAAAFDLILSALEWQALTPETLQAQEDFETVPPPRKDPAARERRRARLLRNGFKKIVNPSNAPKGSIIFEKIYLKILWEQHRLGIHGEHDRVIEIRDRARLERLTRRITSATRAALAENKRNEDCVPNVPGRIQWTTPGGDWSRLHMTANRQLAKLLRENWGLIRALQIRDPLSPARPSFSLDPLRGAAATVRKAYFKFLTALTLADEILERKTGRPTGPDRKTAAVHESAAVEYRDVARIMPHDSHRARCREVEKRLLHIQASITAKTLESILRSLSHL